MITLYQLFDLTGYHQHSKARWFKIHFAHTTKEAKTIEIRDYQLALNYLRFNSKKPDIEWLKTFFSDEPKPADVTIIATPKEQEPEIEFTVTIHTCIGCFYGSTGKCLCSAECKDFSRWLPMRKEPVVGDKDFVPMITRDDYEVLMDSFKDLMEMLNKYEQRLLTLEKRTELPKRAFRTEVINLVNDIAHKYHKSQQELYKEIYQGFDARYNLKDTTKHLKTTFLEWYDKNGYMPKLLNYIKETYKV